MSLEIREIEALKKGADDVFQNAAGTEREVVIAKVGASRPKIVRHAVELVGSKGGRKRIFARQRKWQFGANGSPSTFVDYKDPANFLKVQKSGENQVPDEDGIIIVNRIGIRVSSTVKANTIKALLNGYGLRVHYADDRTPLELPLSEVLGTDMHSVDAGNNSGTAVVGTHNAIASNREIVLDEHWAPVFKVSDSGKILELYKLSDESSDLALTGETADLYFHVNFRGDQFKQ